MKKERVTKERKRYDGESVGKGVQAAKGSAYFKKCLDAVWIVDKSFQKNSVKWSILENGEIGLAHSS